MTWNNPAALPAPKQDVTGGDASASPLGRQSQDTRSASTDRSGTAESTGPTLSGDGLLRKRDMLERRIKAPPRNSHERLRLEGEARAMVKRIFSEERR